ncbi:MAG: D-alanyl-D-alanine carboxypeptidase [Clostridia bacterium]|nr:D-alanyl-D-alanine carboxypeptidase [Clostridia bacterium]
MSEQFNNKDYGEYFSALEKRLEKDLQPTKETEQKSQPITKHNKKVYGGVIRFRPWVYITAVLLIAVLIFVIALPEKSKAQQSQLQSQSSEQTENVASGIEKPQKVDLFAEYTENTAGIGTDIVSRNIIVINCDTNKVVAARGADVRCYPASTTKIMTVLTAVDYITDYNKTFTFSLEITDPLFIADATVAGFSANESVNMTDMLYGAILPSGADATVGLALSLAGSEEEFVKLMNKKAEELGLKDTHFVNTSGLFDENHYTTPEDMSVILRAAMQNELCRKILSTYQYTTAATPQHPDGILLTSTLFSYMYGTEPEGADILGGKTGFVNESGYCIASFGKSDGGTEYICVTLGGSGLWPTVYDQFHLYEQYAK